jgi:primosomal protein N' (replication factor Y) (superfamily II helicase)
MAQNVKRIRVAVPVPFGDGFDYSWDRSEPLPCPGTRVRVPFGRRERIGIVVEPGMPAAIDDAALKPVAEILDAEPLIDAELMGSLKWASAYYHHPLGEVLAQALPGLLRQGKPSSPEPELAFCLTA